MLHCLLFSLQFDSLIYIYAQYYDHHMFTPFENLWYVILDKTCIWRDISCITANPKESEDIIYKLYCPAVTIHGPFMHSYALKELSLEKS